MLLPTTCAHFTTYTPHCEPSLPLPLRPTIYYLTVDGPVDQVVLHQFLDWPHFLISSRLYKPGGMDVPSPTSRNLS